MLFQQACIENQDKLQMIRVEDGRFTAIADQLEPKEGEEVVDLKAKLVLPPFIESHVHLDSVLTAGQPKWNRSGTLFEGIETWALRKKDLSREDIRERVLKVVKMYARHGVQHIRTHADSTDPQLTAVKALCELRDELSEWMDIQVVAFPQEGILSFPNGQSLLEEAVELGVDAVGAIPHYEFNREYSVESLNIALKLAKDHDLLVDVHCDEIDDGESKGLETLATRALEWEMFDRVTASHTTSMASYNDAYFSKLLRLLKLSRINFVANPLVNIHLGGRFDSYPKRRSMTRVKELDEAGLNVSFGQDDIQDPWFPMGNGSLRDANLFGMNVAGMMGYDQLMNAYQFITHHAARTLHIEDRYGLEVGKPANFIVLDSDNYYNAMNDHAVVLASYRQGELLVENQPVQSQFHF